MSGKTTLLRALIARLGQGMKLAVLDERGELTPLPAGGAERRPPDRLPEGGVDRHRGADPVP